MPMNYNTIYLIGYPVRGTDGFSLVGDGFQIREDAEKEAERRAIKTGETHIVFKSISSYEQDEITASKTLYA